MIYQLLKNSFKRHLEETLPLIEQLSEVDITEKLTPETRELGEVVLHLLRSIEFYMKGIVTGQWEPLPYTLETYDSAEAIIRLANDVFDRVDTFNRIISTSDMDRTIDSFSRPVTVSELVLEMLEHSIHHRGQITVYYRLLGVAPKKIPYIV
ncbi:DinB family protein [Candidatus Thorarchaeota archaeon]|nr:MAG: DinB family protein [Candidatus Thorarchaeota archaeon]